ncbi:tRNA (adenosine(37)-N6)-threonylcarbamoyltransferase complex dimerization subunit type 1 TsaB [bacterium 1xD8-6]|jgi:universal bacterial protein YeaZ|nr:tRNA (adenosine(37)-N6)-threonylcarbamoyltransferase complex dimerization subunit type 1 TsaB [bacterium D16-36]RKI71234.1 tRNA (adenosine(37)-N6)-threonylcarbamoyltransferase complex dimerization subunit type 1 TsaB [bacterium 1xD8-6]
MKLLGIDSSGMTASAAIVSGDILVAEFTVNNKQTHSQTLLPMIDQVVKMSGIGLEELDGIAVAAGPGSFTGLRIGSSTAKGMALALNKPIIPVPTLEGMAYRMAGFGGVICPLMDARRSQVYTGIYRMSGSRMECLLEQCAVDILDIAAKVNELNENVVFLGDGVPVHRAVLEEKIKVSYQFAPLHLNRQSAASVAALGMIYMEEGKIEDAKDHKPIYLRQSQAERERAKRLQEQGA